jgi:hypothetical protein
VRACEGSNENTRAALAEFLGVVLISSQQPLPSHHKTKQKQYSLLEALGALSPAFTRSSGGLFKGSSSEFLKTGTATSSGEVRVVVILAHLVFLRGMGNQWLGRNAPTVIQHLLDLLAQPKAVGTHITAVHSRNSILFVLNESFGRVLQEASQVHVAKIMCTLAIRYLTLSKDTSSDSKTSSYQHELVCVFLFLALLVVKLNTAALSLLTSDGSSLSPDANNQGPLLEAMSSGLTHSCKDVRLAAGWCARSIGATLQTELPLLVDYFISKLRESLSSSEAVCGLSSAVAALLASTRDSQLGIPAQKISVALGIASELLSSSKESSVSAAWTLVAGCCSAGSPLVRAHLSTVLQMFKEAFPKSMKELSVEQNQLSMERLMALSEGRAGALASMQCLVRYCGDLVDEKVLRRVLVSVNSTVAMLSSLATNAKTQNGELKGKVALLRLRLYNTLLCLPPAAYEGCLSGVLRELVGEITLTNNMSSTVSSLMTQVCEVEFSSIVDISSCDTDYLMLEQQLRPFSASGAEAIEHDPLVLLEESHVAFPPGALPLGVTVIDSAIKLFGQVFPQVSLKHRSQLLSHFLLAFKSVKSQKLMAVQINVFLAVLASLKSLSLEKDSIGDRSIFDLCNSLIQVALSSSNQLLRCIGAEMMGRLVMVAQGELHVSSLVQNSIALLQTTRDVNLRSGHSLALGCLHKFLGTVGSKNHINTTVAMVTALAKDSTSSLCQIWALYALVLVAESGGPLFRGHTEPTLQVVHQLLVTTPLHIVGVYICLGKCLNSLITALGPELQVMGPSTTAVRDMCVSCTHILLDHPEPNVKATGLHCLQQLQVYAPQHLAMRETVGLVCRSIDESSLVLRRAVANCLRQFSQLEPTITREAASSALGCDLEEHIARYLDQEVDSHLVQDLKEVLYSLLTSLSPRHPMHWLEFCNKLLSSAGDGGKEGDSAGEPPKVTEDDEVGALTVTGDDDQGKKLPSPRWPTRLFAMELVRKVYYSCKSDSAHFDHQKALERQKSTEGDFLVLHLPELVKTSFVAATSDVMQLRIIGYESLKDVISLFGSTPDPDFPEHGLLELYQAQIGAALRPAFNSDTPPHITATACQVCSQWLACGVSGDVGDLSRVQQLLVNSLEKLKGSRSSQTTRHSQFGEAVATLESLAVLRAWAELYIKIYLSKDGQEEGKGMEVIQNYLELLAGHWLSAVQDYALLTLPPQFSPQLPTTGAFFTVDTADSVRPYYQNSWHVLLQAAILWEGQSGRLSRSSSETPPTQALFATPLVSGDKSNETFSLLLGLIVKALCDASTLEVDQMVLSLVVSLRHLTRSSWASQHMIKVPQVAMEILGVLHRVLLTTKQAEVHLAVLKTTQTISNTLGKEGSTSGAGAVEGIMRVVSFVLMDVIFGKDSTTLTTKAAHESFAMAITLLPTVLKLTPPVDMGPNATCVLYIVLSALARPSLSRVLTPVLLQTVKESLLVVKAGQEEDCLPKLISSCLSSLFEGDPSASVDISAMEEELKVSLLAQLLFFVAQPVPPFSNAVELIVAKMENSGQVSIQHKSIRCSCCLLATTSNIFLITQLTPPLLQFVTKSTSKEVLDISSAQVVVEALKGLEAVCLKEGHDEDICEFFFSLLLSLLSDGLPSSQGSRIVHQAVIARLKELGPKYIVVMKKVVAADPGKKAKLENALKASATPTTHKGTAVQRQAQPKAPAITLRQDFSNFRL